jgi:hypothetical protein
MSIHWNINSPKRLFTKPTCKWLIHQLSNTWVRGTANSYSLFGKFTECICGYIHSTLGAWKLMSENLRVVCVEFSTLSLAVYVKGVIGLYRPHFCCRHLQPIGISNLHWFDWLRILLIKTHLFIDINTIITSKILQETCYKIMDEMSIHQNGYSLKQVFTEPTCKWLIHHCQTCGFGELPVAIHFLACSPQASVAIFTALWEREN